MSFTRPNDTIEALAIALGENIYLDIAKWHLYLNDAHLHHSLAEALYPLLDQKPIQEASVLDVLRTFPVKVGGGRHQVPLLDLLPMACQISLIDLLEDVQNER